MIGMGSGSVLRTLLIAGNGNERTWVGIVSSEMGVCPCYVKLTRVDDSTWLFTMEKQE